MHLQNRRALGLRRHGAAVGDVVVILFLLEVI